jgi:hypothetical protein
MRSSTKHPFRYTWDKAIADAIWLALFLIMLVKVVEALSAQG